MHAKAGEIPIIGDVARSDPGLGFGAYVTALADAIRGGTPAQFTIGIYGPWGSGKSSLLNAIAAQLSDDEYVIPVLFDAWRYEAASHIIVPLLHSIYAETQRLKGKEVSNAVRTALFAIMRSISVTLGPIAISGADLLQSSATEEITRLDEAFAKPYAEMRAIGQALGKRRIAVMIDDLDRCSPEKVVSLLESINLVMDIPGFIFVLALDYEVLTRAVSSKYPHTSGHVFIEKMIQVPFRVPRLELPRDSFLSELVPNWTQLSQAFSVDFEEAIYDTANLGLDANPRQIKRLINSLLVLLRIARDRGVEINSRLLVAMMGLQLKWPTEYTDFAEAVLAGDTNPLALLASDDAAALTRYSSHFFSGELSADELRPYLQLTQSVGVLSVTAVNGDITDELSFAGPSAAIVRERNKDRIIQALVGQGYGSYANSDAYYLKRNPDFRVKFGKTVVRFEMKNDVNYGRVWQLGQSYFLTETDSHALTLAQDPREMVKTTFERHMVVRKETWSAERLEKYASRNADLDAKNVSIPGAGVSTTQGAGGGGV